jgi:hypothetical protein
MIKVVSRLASLVIVAGALVFFSNCGGDDPKPSKEEQQFNKLKKTWTIVATNGASLSQGGAAVDRTADFTGFTLNLSANTFDKNSPSGPYDFSVSGTRPTPSPWPSNGEWSIAVVGTGDTGSLLRTDADGVSNPISIAYNISSNGQLTLTFECEDCDYSGSRTEEVNGVWTFILQ